MWTLFLFWLAGGFATIGYLKGISIVEEGVIIDTKTMFIKFMQSWYAYGVIQGIMNTEIGKSFKKII